MFDNEKAPQPSELEDSINCCGRLTNNSTKTDDQAKGVWLGEASASEWCKTLKLFIQHFGSLPPKEAYHDHPLLNPLINALTENRCLPNKRLAAGEAISLLRGIVHDDGRLFIAGYSCAKELRDEVSDTVGKYRTHPQMRGQYWAYTARLHLFIANLLDAKTPGCRKTRALWNDLRETYIPAEIDFKTDINWVN